MKEWMNRLVHTIRYIVWPTKHSWISNPKLFHKQSRISIERVAYICKEAIEHDVSWWEFADSVRDRLKHEEKLLLMLSALPPAKENGE